MKEITPILANLTSMTYENRHNEIIKYSIKTLESLAIELYENDFEWKIPVRDRKMLDEILMLRARKLNTNFTWTPENIDRLLTINDKLMEVCEKTYEEAKSVVSGLEKRIQNNDPFLKDYEVELEVSPYIYSPVDEPVEGMDSRFFLVLSEPLGLTAINDHISHFTPCNHNNPIPLYIDKTKNWNIEYFDEAFSNYYIGYAIHALLDHHWSFSDILGIKYIWGNVKIEHQHFICRI
jgi:hypothetical protein